MYEIVGRNDSELSNLVFGHFTTKELADKGYECMPKEIRNETEIRKSNLMMNAVEIDGEVINLVRTKSPRDIIASRDENNYVQGYVSIHISDIIGRDFEQTLDLLSEELVDSDLLMDINYDVVGLREDEPNTLVFRVSGDVSNIIEEEENYDD